MSDLGGRAMQVYLNASLLVGPKTGIGQYCLELFKALQDQPALSLHYFYRNKWARDLPCSSEKTGRAARRLKFAVAENLPRVANTIYGLQRIRSGINFNAGIAFQAGAVYHEPSFLSFRTKLPTVLTVHDLSVQRYPETHPQYRVLVFRKRLQDSIGRASCVITDSEYVRQEIMAEFGLPESRVVAIPLAASDTFAPTMDNRAIESVRECGLSFGKYVLAVGTLEPRKNLLTLVHAFSQLPDTVRAEFPLVLVGMKGWRMNDFDRHIVRLIEAGQIRRLGYVPDEMLPALYSGARVFVYPSLYEGFGLPPLEAMACGTPVITSNRASLPEVVGNAGIQVDAMDVDALSSAIVSVLEDDDYRAALGVRALGRASQFSWQKCAEETVRVYRRVIG